MEVAVAIVAVSVSAVGLFLAWRRDQQNALRRDEVLDWANEVIGSMQSVALLTSLSSPIIDDAHRRQQLRQAVFDTSILVERGRLFFRNRPDGTHGLDKPQAYRGKRPLVLDPIVVTHQIACRWEAADEPTRLKMSAVAADAVRSFVSLIQTEVGRSKTAATHTRKKGSGTELDLLLQNVTPQRLSAKRPFG